MSPVLLIASMPKTPKPPAPARKAAAKAAARNTDSGPSKVAPDAPEDLAARRMAEVQQVSAAMHNEEQKAAEHGFDNGVDPMHGAVVEAPSRLPGASTLSEMNSSDKVGTEALDGHNATIDTLDRVRVDSTGRALTTNQGVAIADNQNSLKYGLRGPVLLEDFILREKITHFDHERIPERIVHARGSAAHGFFECYAPLTQYTRAAPFREKGKRTPVFVRFSTVQGARGSKDTARDVRGFAVKFYTQEGNWDLVGNNIPVFFIQDAMKFPDLVHSVTVSYTHLTLPTILRV